MNPSRAVARLAQVMGLHKPPAVTFRCNSAQRFVRPDKIGKPQTAGLCHSHRPEIGKGKAIDPDNHCGGSDYPVGFPRFRD